MNRNHNGVYRTNAGSHVGHPQTGFEKWRRRILTAEATTFNEFLQSSFDDIIKIGGKISFWYVNNNNWIPAREVKYWNCVQVKFDNETRYRYLSSFEKEYNEWKAKFENQKRHALLP